jgi:hypothetical protein
MLFTVVRRHGPAERAAHLLWTLHSGLSKAVQRTADDDAASLVSVHEVDGVRVVNVDDTVLPAPIARALEGWIAEMIAQNVGRGCNERLRLGFAITTYAKQTSALLPRAGHGCRDAGARWLGQSGQTTRGFCSDCNTDSDIQKHGPRANLGRAAVGEREHEHVRQLQRVIGAFKHSSSDNKRCPSLVADADT